LLLATVSPYVRGGASVACAIGPETAIFTTRCWTREIAVRSIIQGVAPVAWCAGGLGTVHTVLQQARKLTEVSPVTFIAAGTFVATPRGRTGKVVIPYLESARPIFALVAHRARALGILSRCYPF
jgi:hypothetical protein